MAQELELAEVLDEIEIAKYRRMAVDALTGHFPISIYGDRDHTEVLAQALERCANALDDDNAEEVVGTANDTISNLEAEIEELETKLQNVESEIKLILNSAETATKLIRNAG